MSVYPSEIQMQLYISGSWIDITADVNGDISIEYGIMSTDKTARLSDVGSMAFSLRNDSTCLGGVANYYTPGHTNCLSGFKKGIICRWRVVYVDIITKFYGHINGIYPDIINQRVEIEVLDYADYLVNFPLNLVSVETDKKLGDVADSILSGMAVQPIYKEHGESDSTFAFSLDTASASTRGITELNKAVLSEFGYCFIRHGSPDYDEIFQTRGRHDRSFLSEPKKIPLNYEYLIDEDGFFILDETGNKIMLNEWQDYIHNDNMTDLVSSYGNNIINSAILKTYPRRIDDIPAILYSMNQNSPVYLSSSSVQNVTATYRDSSQKSISVSGYAMINPVSGSENDYYFTSGSSDGADFTDNLIISASFAANNANLDLINSGSNSGYIRKLQLRGTGIYIDSNLNYNVQESTSINTNGIYETSIDMKYQGDPLVAQYIGTRLVTNFSDPSLSVDSIEFIANHSDELMLSFLFIEPGDMIYLKNTKLNLDEYHYIQGINATCTPGKVITFSWILTDAKEKDEIYWILGTSVLGTDTILGGY